MYKRLLYTLWVLASAKSICAQSFHFDSLKQALHSAKTDTSQLILYGKIARAYTEISPDSVYNYSGKMLSVAKKLKIGLEQAHAMGEMGYAQLNMADYLHSLQTLLSAIAIAEDPATEKNVLPSSFPEIDEFGNRSATPRMQRLSCLAKVHQFLGILYNNTNNHEKSLTQHHLASGLAEETGNLKLLCTINLSMSRAYFGVKKPDSALVVVRKAHDLAMKLGYKRYLGSIYLNEGRVYVTQGKRSLAIEYFNKAIEASAENDYIRGVAASNLALADLYKQSGPKDSVLEFINNALTPARHLNAPDLLIRTYTAFANYYRETGNNDSAVKYQALIIKLNDSLFSSKQAQQFQNIDFDEEQRQQQIESAKESYRVKIRTYLLLAGLAIFLLVALIIWRNSKRIKVANALLSRQKEELQSTLTMLKKTQKQLVQSEKMASLGELTAGIAHEIQNPLNFVNNFSEVNSELIDELQQEVSRGNLEEAKTIARSIRENQEKITTHGKRADSIVKGMLQHSRTSAGVKELTDINALADEYFRLAYHGLRAKDKSFNAIMKSELDPSVGKIEVIPQEIGRVILNLITNAFYVVMEKKKNSPVGFEPRVTVSTATMGNRVEIRVSDNGNGIPHHVMDKIFQPFFTTKPPGKGTGLGLSLSYDIVKAHEKELKVETWEGEGTVFTIELQKG